MSSAVNKMLQKAYSKLGDGGAEIQDWYGIGRLAWCAMFVCWTAYQGFGDKWTDYLAKTALASLPKASVEEGKATWVKAPGSSTMSVVPQPGDVFAISAEGYTYAHTGMVYEVHPSERYFMSIEGNWGNKVSSVKRTYDSVYCIAHPNWGSAGSFDFQAGIKKLYSTYNYKYLEEEEKDTTLQDNFNSSLINDLNKLKGLSISAASEETIIAHKTTTQERQVGTPKPIVASNLLSAQTWVEAPLIEVSFNGVTIGGYGNAVDTYPNYINSMSVNKINGKINQYILNLSYQVRPGDDVNLIDKLISRVGYRNKLKIRYGDSQYCMYREEEAIVTDVNFSESVSSSIINYTIKALSSSSTILNSYYTFPAKTDKPSNIIRNLLYNSGQISTQLKEVFSGMVSSIDVDSRGLIPTDDKVVTISGYNNITVLDYIIALVSNMVGTSDDTPNYFITFDDSSSGTYFKISKLSKANNISDTEYNKLYYVDVGYPGDNFVTKFELVNNIYWPIVYEYNDSIDSFEYGIDDSGIIYKQKINSLYRDNKYYQASATNKNWWKHVTEYPISAKLTIKGLVKPVMLISYIRINALFYGREDLASGLYVITAQEDTISGNGYSTTLTLLRIGD